MRLIDIGANLTHDSFDHDRAAVLQRARDAGVSRMIVTGASREHSPKALALAQQHPGELFATAGVHPHHAIEYTEECDAEMRALHAHPEVVAVGECGLDYFRDFSPRPAQRKAFERQLLLASENGKPLFYAGPSNKSPALPEYATTVQQRIEQIRLAHPEKAGQPVPVDLLTESGSGLDPHISPAAAEYQVERLARATGFTPAEVRRTIAMYTEGRTLGLLGEARVNVLMVNLALEGLLANGKDGGRNAGQTAHTATTQPR